MSLNRRFQANKSTGHKPSKKTPGVSLEVLGDVLVSSEVGNPFITLNPKKLSHGWRYIGNQEVKHISGVIKSYG